MSIRKNIIIIHCLISMLLESTYIKFQEFSRASPLGTPSGKGLYLTIDPLSRPNTDTVYSVGSIPTNCQ